MVLWNAVSTATSGFGSFLRPASAASESMASQISRMAFVAGLERQNRLFFRHLLGAGLDHHDAVLAAGDDQVEAAFLALREGRVDDVLPVDQADADAGDRLLERHLRQRQRRGGAGDREHVAVVLDVGRDHERDDLRFEVPAGREERTNRPVDAAAGEDFLLGRLAFALEEAARNAARGVGIFAIVDGEREEVDSLARGVGMTRRDEHHGVALADDDRSVGLLGQFACLDGQGPLADLNLTLVHNEPRLGSRSPVR